MMIYFFFLNAVSDLSQIADDDLYTVDQINSFLDKGKTIPVEQYFNTFVISVIKACKTVGYDVLSKQKQKAFNRNWEKEKRLDLEKFRQCTWANSVCGVSSFFTFSFCFFPHS